MDKYKVIENVFISPSAKMSFDWSGKDLEISFDEELDSNTTYVFSLGTEYTDLKQNKPDEAFTLIFSTGNYLDSGVIEGNLIDKNSLGVFIYAFKIDNILPDTLNPKHTKPNYRTQVGTTGSFKLSALKDGKYRLFAIRDVAKNELYDEGTDDFGAAPFDVEVLGENIPNISLKIGSSIDKTGPLLFNAESAFNDLIALNFSEPLDTFSIQPESIIIKDTLSGKTINTSAAMISPDSPDKILLIPSEKLDTSIVWQVILSTDTANCIKDTLGNKLQDTAFSTKLYAEFDLDTIKIDFKKIAFKDSTKGIALEPDFRFNFERPVKQIELNDNILLISEENENINFIADFIADNIISIKPTRKLITNKSYNLSFKLNDLCYYNQSCFADSTLHLNFKTIDTRNYGSAKGTIKGLNQADSLLKIVFIGADKRFTTSPADSGKWIFESIPEGKYKIELFYDLNNNGKYDFGDAYPFKHSEPFLLMKEEKDVPMRWTLEMVLPMIER
jgi:uncharacterized protein (DUF2141 family)